MLYKITTFLTPKLRQLKMVDDNERQAVIHAVKVLVDELGFDEDNTEENLQPPPPKRTLRSGRMLMIPWTATCHLIPK